MSAFACKIQLIDSKVFHTSSYSQIGITEDFIKLTLSTLLSRNTTFSDITTDSDTPFIKAVAASTVSLSNTTFNRVVITNSLADSTAELDKLTVTDSSRTFLVA